MKIPAIVLLIALPLPGFAQSFQTDYEQFRSVKANDYAGCIEKGSKLIKTVRYPSILYRLAECYCQADSLDKSFSLLSELAIKGLPYDVANNKNFDKLYVRKGFRTLVPLFTTIAKPVLSSENAFTLDDPGMIPEGIAATADGKRFFVSSLAQHKIVEHMPDSRQKDFIPADCNGIWMVLGMKVSPDGKTIWVCSASEKEPYNGYSGIFGFDLATGKLVNKYILDNKDRDHLFNDLVITSDNVLYFTDSKAGKVYTLNLNEGRITPLVAQDFIYPNGIALDEGTNTLYVADRTGITCIYLPTQVLVSMENETRGYLNYIDGLYYYKNSLIAIQSSGNDKDRVVRFNLSSSKQKIESCKVLEAFHPDYQEPTTGVIVNDDFYFIAISHVSHLQPDGTITHPEQLKKPLIKKIRLN
ncbi:MULTISPECIES: SMP-30/gluconolactonase/LRE family protein [Niastella]|uniref:SMP-30/gluconolactonase/LRE family protein n=1 Tax=Niastella soli TaxID=2821487 RepID=A0ABS3Z2H7_9BACT|nr:SMP-30/gluconolactonase/LRE family protein [Niastella soli]MBO9204364.1 SMP-30/gluconolactonase/LRE family protein [Niastella soli]